ncbi:MAG: hypothetical protein AMXMBFR46_24310 [Acidimicrobiia bacterium]
MAPPWGRSLRLTARYVPAWLAIGGATATGGHAVIPSADPTTLFAAAVASWLAGFLFLPAPGGIGVREVTFAAVVPVAFGTAFAAAALARMVFVAVDLTAFAVAVVADRRVSAASVLHDMGSEALASLPPALPVERAVGS